MTPLSVTLEHDSAADNRSCLCPSCTRLSRPQKIALATGFETHVRPSRPLERAMKGIAKLTFPGGGIVLPGRTPYERELLVEHIQYHVRRRSALHLELDGHNWSIVFDDSFESDHCATCQRTTDIHAGNHMIKHATFCLRCVIAPRSSDPQLHLVQRLAAG